jgi:hypothetical protein
MAKYNFEIQSRAIYCGPEERSFGELFDFTLLADFADDAEADNTFTIGVKSDYLRQVETGEYFTNQQYMGSQSSTERINVRHNLQIVPRVGFFGSFFEYRVTKKIPSDGLFMLFGMRGEVTPMNVDQEFLAGLDAIADGWD